MNWTGKIIGGLIGLFIYGPLGALIGIFIGHLFDRGVMRAPNFHNKAHQLIQKVFFRSTFTIMGYLAKSDGRVSEKEIAFTEQVMAQMGLNTEQKRQAIAYFNEGKQPHFDVQQAVNELRQACLFQPSLLRTFLEIQMNLAFAEGDLTPAKRAALQSICQQLGIQGFNFNQYEQQERASYDYQRHRQQARYDTGTLLKDAYQMLGVTPQDTDADIKKAYKRLMSKNHPDKLMSKGLSPEMIKLATQKTQQIKSAYETIKKARGMK